VLIAVGSGGLKANATSMVGGLYHENDDRRDAGFSIFYMGINIGALLAPLVTQYLAKKVFGIEDMPAYKIVFIAAGVGMVLSLVWFWFGRQQLKGIGLPAPGQEGLGRVGMVAALGLVIGIPLFYSLLTIDANLLQGILMALFIIPAIMLLREGAVEGAVSRDKVIAMLVIFVFNVLFWMFFEQAGSSFNFLADRIVNRDIGMTWLFQTFAGTNDFPVSWFQSVNSVAIIALAPILAWLWVKMGKNNPIIPRKFGLGLIFNGLAFLLLMVALSSMVDGNGKIPFWTLFMVYVIQSVGELCLSPIGLSMTTKLAPTRLAGMAMGCWFLSIAIGNNLAGIFAGQVSGAGGMTVQSAHAGYTFGFWALVGSGVVLFLVAPLIQKLMHGVK
jgi:POT family proton-dependent oligopeptide transporter